MRNPWWLFLGALLCAAGMGLYLQRVVIPHQVAEAAAHGRPRGNFSDLYPRWLGARELLLRGRDPYSSDVTREIQTGYYGRPLDSSRPEDPKDEQRFAYPVYVVFVLAPTVELPFEVVQKGVFWLLLFFTIAGVLLWLRILHWSPSPWMQLSLILFMIGSPAVMQALKLRQLSLLVAALVCAALVLLASDHLSAAGSLLAVATIKPQLVWLLLLWLALWTISDYRRRYRLALSFLITMIVLVAASELWLPHWIPRFWDALREYQRYTGAASVIDKMISPAAGRTVTLFSLAMTGMIGWRERNELENSQAFTRMLCLILSVTVLVAPTVAPYNQILLLPAMLLMVRDWSGVRQYGIVGTFLIGLMAAATAWPWLSSIVLATLSFALPPQTVQNFWTVPFWTVWLIPVSVAALMLVIAYRGSFPGSKEGVPA